MSLLALHCGLRAGEIRGLLWRHVDLKKGVLLLLDTKNGEARTAHLTDSAIEMLRGRLTSRDKENPFVFVNRNGSKYADIPVTFSRTVAKLGFNSGVTDPRDKIVFHSLRHTFASWMTEQGEGLRLVGDLLGHKSLVMTQRYAHVSESEQRRAVAKYSEAMKPKNPDVVNLADRRKKQG
jgi:integrase